MTRKAAQSAPNHLLRMARLERGWTQKDVADRIGAPLDLNVTRWERGTARPSAYYVQKLCELFGKSASDRRQVWAYGCNSPRWTLASSLIHATTCGSEADKAKLQGTLCS